jgi:hypothetical protein
MVLLHALDPANLYGPSAPLGWPLGSSEVSVASDPVESATTDQPASSEVAWSRRAGNWLVTKAGRVILAIESQGKRLWPSPAAKEEELYDAVQVLADMLKTGHGVDLRSRIVVEAWNGQPAVSSPARVLLEAVGFVRDYQAMSLYAAWA